MTKKKTRAGERIVKGTDLMIFNLTDVPRSLIAAGKAKCAAMVPTRPLRAQLIYLLQEWIQNGQNPALPPRQDTTERPTVVPAVPDEKPLF